MTDPLLVRIALFVVASAPIAWVSGASLRTPGSHGFWRFFAWECMLALFFVNMGRWFRNPLSAPHIASWLLLGGSAFLVFHAVIVFRRFGGRNRHRSDAPLFEFEKTAHLVTEGVFGYVRHPMYTSLLLLAWGILLKHLSPLATGLAAAATAFLVATAKADEAECLRFFGEEYRAYMARTRMFIPNLF